MKTLYSITVTALMFVGLNALADKVDQHQTNQSNSAIAVAKGDSAPNFAAPNFRGGPHNRIQN